MPVRVKKLNSKAETSFKITGGKATIKKGPGASVVVAPAPMSAQKLSLNQRIKRIINNMDETKYRSEIIVNNAPYNSQVSTADIIRLLPKLVQDQGQGRTYEREGMQIRPQSLKVNCLINLTDVARSSALVVCYWVLQSKDVRDTGNLGTLNLGAHLLRTGDSSEEQGFNGFGVDAMIPVNPARFQVLKQGKFLLGKNTGTVQDDTTGGNQPMYGNHILKRLNFSLKVPKKLTYVEDTNTPRTIFYPKTYAPFIVFGYYHQNQTTPDVLNQDISITVRTHLRFDDS